MRRSDSLKKQIAAALQQEVDAVKEAGALAIYDMEVTLHKGGRVYANPRVTSTIKSFSAAPTTHVKGTPLVDRGILVVQAVPEEEPGSTKLSLCGTECVAFSATHSLKKLGVEPTGQRCPVTVETISLGSEERKVLLIQVKAKSKRSRRTKT